ncbi:MAG: hypothetical protein RR396_03815, partial [Clostridiales bacterium]
MTEGTITKRIAGLKNSRFDDFIQAEAGERDRLYQEALDQYADLSMEKRYAYGFANVLAKKRILIREDDLIGGFFQQYTSYATLPMIKETDTIEP